MIKVFPKIFGTNEKRLRLPAHHPGVVFCRGDELSRDKSPQQVNLFCWLNKQ